MIKCPNCKVPFKDTSGCQNCFQVKQTFHTRLSFFSWFKAEFGWLYIIQFSAASIINGFFMRHFNYSCFEILVQAVCLGIILSGVFNRG